MFNWMALSKGCVKGLLLVLNLICILTALCLFVCAVVDIKILKQYSEEYAAGCITSDLVLIGISVVLVMIAVLGCIGTITDNLKILYVYVICILMLVVLELLVAIHVSVQRYGFQFRISEWLREDFYKNSTDIISAQKHEKLWDKLQSTYECCGLNEPKDYALIGRPISISCCEKAHRTKIATAKAIMYRDCIESATYYKHGCEDEIIEHLEYSEDWFYGMIITSFWFEALGMLLALWVAKFVKNSVKIYKNTVKY